MKKLSHAAWAVFVVLFLLLLPTAGVYAQRLGGYYGPAYVEDWTDLLPSGVSLSGAHYRIIANDHELFLVVYDGVATTIYRSIDGEPFQTVIRDDDLKMIGKLVVPASTEGFVSVATFTTATQGLFFRTMSGEKNSVTTAYSIVGGITTKIVGAGDVIRNAEVINVDINGKPVSTRKMDLDVRRLSTPFPASDGRLLAYLDVFEDGTKKIRSGAYECDSKGNWKQLFSTVIHGTSLDTRFGVHEIGGIIHFMEQYNSSRYLTRLIDRQTGEKQVIQRFSISGTDFGDPITISDGRQLPTQNILMASPIDQKTIRLAVRYFDYGTQTLRGYIASLEPEGSSLQVKAEIPSTLNGRQVVVSTIYAASDKIGLAEVLFDSFEGGERGIVLCQNNDCQLVLKESDSLPGGGSAFGIGLMTASGCNAWAIVGSSLIRIAVPPCADINTTPPAVITGITSATGDPKAAYAPGDFLTAYGQYLCGYLWNPELFPLPQAVVNSAPFSYQIGGCHVRVNGQLAPMHFGITWANDFSSQSNFLLPEDTAPGSAQVVFERLRDDLTIETVSDPSTIMVSNQPSPRPFRLGDDGSVIMQNVSQDHTGGTLVSPTTPARPDDWLITYWAGWGYTDPPVKPGQTPERLATVVTWYETYTFDGSTGGWARAESVAALTWQFPGVYQLNLRIPENVVVDSQGRAYVRVFFIDIQHYVDFVTYVSRD